MFIIELLCPNAEEPLTKKIIMPREADTLFSHKYWTDLLKPFDECPHPLKGKTVRVASQGTNPFIFTDYERNVVYNDKGLPLGANTGIASSLSKVFGFQLEVKVLKEWDHYDNKTGKWTGMAGGVC